MVGAILILAGCSGLGMVYKTELYEGLRHLRVLREMFEMMMSEISYRRSTLPECCRQIGKNMEEPYKSSLHRVYELSGLQNEMDFCTCWRQELNICLEKIPISSKEKEMVLGFVTNEGLSDYQMQLRSIEQYRDMIDSNIKKREAEVQKQGKMMTGLGIMSGLLLIVILL